jgi:hypothetical protein
LVGKGNDFFDCATKPIEAANILRTIAAGLLMLAV